MKRTPRPARHLYDPAEHPQPPEPSADEIGALADRVMAGQTVVAPFQDGTFVSLMAELKLRGWFSTERTGREKAAAPFVIKVAPASASALRE